MPLRFFAIQRRRAPIAAATLGLFMALAFVGRVHAQCELDKLTASDAAAGARYGVAAAIDGAVAVVGAPDASSATAGTGQAYVLRRTLGVWSEAAILSASDGATDDDFGFCVSVSGDVIVVGAPKHTAASFADAGAVYVYRFNGSTWVEEDILTASDAAAGSAFGSSLAVSGGRLVVGAPTHDEGASTDAGAAYVFAYSATTSSWSEEAKLTATDIGAGEQYGFAVAIDGTRAVITNRFNDDAAGSLGAFVFDFGTSWTHTATLVAADGATGAGLGASVAVRGALVVVGAPSDDDGATNAGSVYVFRESGAPPTWAQEVELSASDELADNAFGVSVAISSSGGVLAVGATGGDGTVTNSGAAYLFLYGGTTWAQDGKATAADGADRDEFGTAIGISGTTLIVGSPRDDDAGTSSGAAYLFDESGLDCNTNSIDDLCDIASGTSEDCNANGIPDECDIASATSEDCNANTIPDECEGALDPVISANPLSQSACTGDNVMFGVTATGTGTLSYQWRRDGIALAGETAATLALTAVASLSAGSYDVIITDDCGTATSNAAVLTVSDDPVIGAVSPASDTVCAGESVTFSVTATGSDAASYTYQWRLNGVGIVGASSSSYTIASAVAGSAGTYDVVVTNACGSTTSSSSLLTVDAATEISAQPVAVSVCEDEPASFTVTATGSGTLTYQWRWNGVDITGATGDSLAFTAVTSADAGSYDVVVTGGCGAVTSSTATLTLLAPTTIDTNPASTTVCSGDGATLTVVASGSALTYQWRKGGIELAGATSSSLSFAAVTGTDAGSYDVVVTGDCGSATSVAATLTVEAVTAISGGITSTASEYCEGDAATLSVAATGAGTLSYQWQKNGVDIAGATAASHVIASFAASDAGSYTVTVTGNCGSATSAAFALALIAPPLVDSIAASTTTPCAGEAIEFDVVVSEGRNLTYQWQKDGVAITGATSATFSIAAATASDSGVYTVLVGGDCGEDLSPEVTIAVRATTAIGTQPVGASHCPGDTATFTVVATGAGTLTYQWRRDGLDLVGATGASHGIASVSAADAGSYSVVVTGECGSVTSDAASLTVVDETTITTEPTAVSSCEGGAASFSVAADGSGVLTYQWRRNGADLAGATAATLSIDPVSAADSGSYDVVVSGDCGAVTSSAVALSLVDPTAIATDPADTTVCDGAGATFAVVASGSTLSYQWRKNGVDIAGATGSSLGFASVSSADEGSYDVVVSGDCGSETSSAATLTVEDLTAIGAITSAESAYCEGDAATLSVAATGAGTFTYQWRKDGVDLAGATSASYAIASFAATDVGTYDVTVTGNCGSATSDPFDLALLLPPVVDSISASTTSPCVGDSVGFMIVVSQGTNLTYQWRKDGVAILGATGSSFSIESAAESDSGDYSVLVGGDCGEDLSPEVSITVRADTAIVTPPSGATLCPGETAVFSVVATGAGTLSYQWRVGGEEIAGATDTTYVIPSVGDADVGDYDVVVSGECSSVTSDVATLVVLTDTSITLQPRDASACDADSHTFTVAAAGSNLTYQWRKDGVAIAGATASSLTIDPISALDAASYDVEVGGDCGAETSSASFLTVTALTRIETQPADGTPCEGTDFALSVVASGTGPLTYVWRKDSLDIAGATESSLMLTSVAPGNTGFYEVEVSGPCGVVASETVIVEVRERPEALLGPESSVVCLGDSLALSVFATGAGTLDYQWRKDGLDIAGATASSFAIDVTTSADSGAYDVVIDGDCGRTISPIADVLVVVPASIEVQPIAANACEGAAVTLSVTAGGTEPIAYQWSKDGVEIGGATSATLIVDPLPADGGGSYTVEATNFCGAASSDAAEVVVDGADVCGPSMVRGDSNNDGDVDIGDAIGMITYLFLRGDTDCVMSNDANDDNIVNIADPIWLLSWQFRDGPAMSAPWPNCGADPTRGGLSCDAYSSCD